MTPPTTSLARAEPRGSCHREGTFTETFYIHTLLLHKGKFFHNFTPLTPSIRTVANFATVTFSINFPRFTVIGSYPEIPDS